MKLKAIVSALSLKKSITKVVAVAVTLIAPLVGMCQPPDPGPFPDEGVPFDSNMNMLFLAAGVIFAVYITVKQLRSKAEATA